MIAKVNEIRRNRRAKLIELFGGACSRCGYDRCRAALEFHHEGPKAFALNTREMRRKWDDILAEAKKCVLVCSNCHKEIHSAG